MSGNVDVAEVLGRAKAAHGAGRVEEAVRLYEEVLGVESKHVEALLGAGTVAAHRREWERAVELIARAGALQAHPVIFRTLAQVHGARGAWREAEGAARRAVELAPGAAENHVTLGEALHRQGKLAPAAAAFARAAEVEPWNAGALISLSAVLSLQEKFAEAAEALRRAIVVRPGDAALYYRLGTALYAAWEPAAAVDAYRRALEFEAGHDFIYADLAVALVRDGRTEDARAVAVEGLARFPESGALHRAIGLVQMDAGELEHAVESFRRATGKPPANLEAWMGMGNALALLNRFEEAIVAADEALKVSPGDAGARLNRGVYQLTLGRWKEGFEDFEARFGVSGTVLKPLKFDRPGWDGSDPRGKTILVWGEQGIGDQIQFARYATELSRRGARVVMLVGPEVRKLMEGIEGATVVSVGDAVPAFDVHAPLMSLPRMMGTTAGAVPWGGPYVRADERLLEKWRGRLASDGVKVGLVWAGNPKHSNDRNRSGKLSDFALLGRVTGVKYYSLQKGGAAGQVREAPFAIEDLGAEIASLDDTAAILANLDLLVAVDTAPVHLAGAMGRAVWTVLAYSPDWRWGLGSETTVWYPTMRLFRQDRPRDWAGVMGRVAEALTREVKS